MKKVMENLHALLTTEFKIGDDIIQIILGTAMGDSYDAQVIIKQLAITHNGKALFGGVGDPSRPGSVIIYKISDDKTEIVIEKTAEKSAM